MVFLQKCQSLKEGWAGHQIGGDSRNKRQSAPDDDDYFKSKAAFERADSTASEKTERDSEIEEVRDAVKNGELTDKEAVQELAERDAVAAEKSEEEALLWGI